MNSTALDSLIRAVTTIFVLSLAVERVTSLFKAKDLQPLRPLRHRKKDGIRVDLARSHVVTLKANGDTEPVTDVQLCRDSLRAVITENTVFLGMLLALVTGANAFEAMPGVGRFSALLGITGGKQYLLSLPGVFMTGAAAAIGSSFWYDLLGLLIEVRRTKQDLATAKDDISKPGADLTALKDGSLLFRKRREVLEAQLQAWTADGTIKSGEVIDVFEAPYLALRVQPAAGRPVPATVTVQVEGASLDVKVQTRP